MKNKEKYNLRQIDVSTKTEDGKILFFELKIRGKTIHQQIYPCGVYACDAMKMMIGWLEEEYVPEILTEREKAYLSAVIKPFRKDVEWIERMDNSFVNGNQHQFLCISLTNDYCCLPLFKKDTMYKGMEVNKRYTLEELGL